MIEKADSAGIIFRENHAQSGSTALEVEFLWFLMMDISHQRRYFMAFTLIHAANCYDCVGHAFLSLACRTRGPSSEEIKVMNLTFVHIQFFLRSGFGSPTRFYGADPNNPL